MECFSMARCRITRGPMYGPNGCLKYVILILIRVCPLPGLDFIRIGKKEILLSFSWKMILARTGVRL
jgi:hypothetical protein